MAASSLARVQAALAAAVVLVSGVVLGHLTLVSDEVAFLPPGEKEGWIGFSFPAIAGVLRTEQPPPPFVFRRAFELSEIPRSVRLEVAALETVQLELNGEALLPAARHAWRGPLVLEVAERLRTGRNELRASVHHRRGPPLLKLQLTAGYRTLLASDETWTVSPPGGPAESAHFVDDTRRHPQSLRVPEPGEILAERAPQLLGLLLLGTGIAFACQRWLPHAARRHLPLALLLGVSLGWALLLVGRLAALPLQVGFDAEGHLAYVEYLRERGTLPLANEGFSMFHPPLFYALLFGLTGAVGSEPGTPGAGLAYRLVPMAAGLGSVWLVWLAARRIFDGDALRTGLAVGVAGLLPMHVYMSAFVSNESTSTLTASALLAVALAAILAPRLSGWLALALAALGGLVLLSKYSGIVVVPIALGAVALRVWLVDGRSLARAVALGVAMGVGAFAVGGWFYVRNVVLLGTPLPWNFELGGVGLWWHLPGFHTLEYFTLFGESLRHPLFAGFYSYADGLYGTAWGDALAAGASSPLANPAGWARPWMLATYPLAFPATLLACAGVLRAGARALRGSGVRLRLAWTLVLLVLWVMALSHLGIVIRFPSYAASKAFYAMPAFLPLVLVAALGLAWPAERLAEERMRPLRALYFGALSTLAAVLVLSFRG